MLLVKRDLMAMKLLHGSSKILSDDLFTRGRTTEISYNKGKGISKPIRPNYE